MPADESAASASWHQRLSLQRESPLPLYYQLREYLRAFAQGLGPNVLMPSENEMLQHTGVSRATVRKAVSDLIQEGVLRTQQGRGTFTTDGRVETSLDRPAGFTESISGLGRKPRSVVVQISRATAKADLAAQLQIEPDAELVVIERLRLIDDRPAMLERMHLAAALVPGIAEKDLTGSAYALLRDDYGLVASRGIETIIAVSADERLSELLEVGVGSPLLQTTRVSESAAGVPIEYTLRHARGDICSFAVPLTGGSALVATA